MRDISRRVPICGTAFLLAELLNSIPVSCSASSTASGSESQTVSDIYTSRVATTRLGLDIKQAGTCNESAIQPVSDVKQTLSFFSAAHSSRDDAPRDPGVPSRACDGSATRGGKEFESAAPGSSWRPALSRGAVNNPRGVGELGYRATGGPTKVWRIVCVVAHLRPSMSFAWIRETRIGPAGCAREMVIGGRPAGQPFRRRILRGGLGCPWHRTARLTRM